MSNANIEIVQPIEESLKSAGGDSSSMLHEHILASMDNGVIALDFEGKIITFNPAAAKILGIQADFALGKYYPEVFFELPGNDDFNDILIQVIDTRETHLYREVTFMRNAETPVPLGVTSSLLKNEQGHEYGVVSVFSDLTEAKKRQFLQDTLTRYVTRQVVDVILQNPEKIILDGEERNATVMFSDIRRFTSISEKMSPKELVYLLREYFTLMVGAVFRYQGTVDKFIGDCIMAIFGAPAPQPEHAQFAVQAALEMKLRLQVFNTKRAQAGKEPIRVGVGINTGEVVVGNIGSEQRLEYTAIGDAVNLASRLEGITKQYGVQILISEFTYREIEGQFIVRELDDVRVKGKLQPVKIYEVIAAAGESIPTEELAGLTHFRNGLTCYKKRQWEPASQHFQQALHLIPSDCPARLYLDRCAAYKKNPPADAWDGVFEMLTK